jgi:hypothetical protein
MPRPSHPSWLDNFNYTWRRVQGECRDSTLNYDYILSKSSVTIIKSFEAI